MIDPADALVKGLRYHPRVEHQGLTSAVLAARLAESLPPLIPFQGEGYEGVIPILDWDHRLPSRQLVLRIYAFASSRTLGIAELAFHERAEEIRRRDKFPEFDVPDFEELPADEAYAGEVSLEGALARLRLTSPWRRDIADEQGSLAATIARRSPEFRTIRAESVGRATHLGDLEAVGWCPPCESGLGRWTIDVWYLTAFDGQVGHGKSLLVDMLGGRVVSVREFSVRAG